MKDKLRAAELRANTILDEHGLVDWSVSLNNKTTSVAEVNHIDKKMTISKRFIVIADKNEFDGVVYHEVAHALLGPGKGHGEEFMKLCKSISPTDEYATECLSIPVHYYKAVCPECGYDGYTNRRSRLYCPFCYEKGMVVEFSKKRNELKLKSWD